MAQYFEKAIAAICWKGAVQRNDFRVSRIVTALAIFIFFDDRFIKWQYLVTE